MKKIFENKWVQLGSVTAIAFLSVATPVGLILWFAWFIIWVATNDF
jgi:hypothetical protein